MKCVDAYMFKIDMTMKEKKIGKTGNNEAKEYVLMILMWRFFSIFNEVWGTIFR
jgi:hypothetical protein